MVNAAISDETADELSILNPVSANETVYVTRRHSAVRTTNYIFNQLIPYIGNKRKLLDLIGQALPDVPVGRERPVFLDLFSGSGVVARYAKNLGYKVVANDWEPYSSAINGCYIACNRQPDFEAFGGYQAALDSLNQLPPRIDWVTEHLCPRDDNDYDVAVDRMFFMRKNGMRIDAIRHQILNWHREGLITDTEQNCLLAPLLYQTCYASNTSGVFKGFHHGWGGKSGTALYRIAGDLAVTPAVFFDNGARNEVFQSDAQQLAEHLSGTDVDVAYLDPPYNQHPYGSNYHVLNSVALWDKPALTKSITGRTKSAIRMDWRTERRSAYNHASEASKAYRRLVHTLNARYILTSYSTDGTIPLEHLLAANADRGHVSVQMKGYKRYRVSSTRFSEKPMNVEFIVVLDTHRTANCTVDELCSQILNKEESILSEHPETAVLQFNQPQLF